MHHLSHYDYPLPAELIAQYPLESRVDSRLLCVDKTHFIDKSFKQFIDLIQPHDLLVFNNTKVMKARLFGKKKTGGKVEILIERLLDTNTALAHIKASKAPKPQSIIELTADLDIQIIERQADLFKIHCVTDLNKVMENSGHLPLPPYITRSDEALDQARYQTVYAQQQGAIAAPTAGLHFDTDLLAKLAKKGVAMGYLTLHVGAGTFQPVRVEDLSQHQMHSEWVDVNADLVAKIQHCQQQGGRVIAIGTTSVRGLESAARETGEIQNYQGDTDIFIRPPYEFKVVDAILTNFHLPKSTLLMLVSAFAGYDITFKAYQHAIKEKYRFFSYGDAMFLIK